MAENRVIGRDNGLPWHLPADFKRFKLLTTGHTLIMGRKTFVSIGKALPGRRTIVLTRDRSWKAPGVEVTHDLSAAIERAAGDSEAFVAGGADVYQQALARAERIYLTLIRAQIPGDARFPELPASEWTLSEDEPHVADERHLFAFNFQLYQRVK